MTENKIEGTTLSELILEGIAKIKQSKLKRNSDRPLKGLRTTKSEGLKSSLTENKRKDNVIRKRCSFYLEGIERLIHGKLKGAVMNP